MAGLGDQKMRGLAMCGISAPSTKTQVGAELSSIPVVLLKICAPKECLMARCDVCGNDYDKAFRVSQGDRTMTFDSFECAIDAMAPRCAHCQCRVIGRGVEAKGKIYCCAHCAKHDGARGVSDRAA